ncbi:hypothetical protein TRFO_08817 [Tritrichomonas foetus]|uniref:Uncharacterized protein n=1 Tax=Tritrichomonas foetus TaxID=1144522 RepID=A0A1J4JHD1_9EUKA|nr:hypothetical protein TRFO_08817 [Tritrichomonas foetus]|eukprot:OHS98542.1 hypothetical protein TRFO_08817 [Tritrichomonas foetus]
MQDDLHNINEALRKGQNISDHLKSVDRFLQQNSDYIFETDEIKQINEILKFYSEKQSKESDLIKILQPFLIKYYVRRNISYDARNSFISACITSQNYYINDIGVNLLITLYDSNPIFLLNFLEISEEPDLFYAIFDLDEAQCKKMKPILKLIVTKSNFFAQILYFLIQKFIDNHKKLKIVAFTANFLGQQQQKKFIQLIRPEESTVLLYFISVSKNVGNQIIQTIVKNYKFIDIYKLCRILSKNHDFMRAIVNNNKNIIPLHIIDDILENTTNNFDCVDINKFFPLFSKDIDNETKNTLLRIFFNIAKKKGVKVHYFLLRSILVDYPSTQSFRFFRKLISDDLFLYSSDSDFPKFMSEFEKYIINNGINSSPACIDLYAALIRTIKQSKDEYFHNLFNLYIKLNVNNTKYKNRLTNELNDENVLDDEESVLNAAVNSIISLFLSDRNIFIQTTKFVFDFFVRYFEEHPGKVIWFLKKYFSKSNSIYPISDFNQQPHNKAFVANKKVFFLGPNRKKFLFDSKDTIESLQNRIMFYYDILMPSLTFGDPKIPLINLNNGNDIEYNPKSVNFPNSSKNVHPILLFYQNNFIDTLFNYLETRFNNNEDQQNILYKPISKKITKILNLMPNSNHISEVIIKNQSKFSQILTSSQNSVHLRYLLSILNDYPKIINLYIDQLFILFNKHKNVSLKQDIISLFLKSNIENCDYSPIFKSLFNMMKSPKKLNNTFHSFLTYLIEKQPHELDTFLASRDQKIFQDPPKIIWDIIMKVISMKKKDEFDILKKNKSNEFGSFLASHIFSKLSVKNTDLLLKLLPVSGFRTFQFFQSLFQSLLMLQNKIELSKKHLKKLCLIALETDDSQVRNEIFNFFSTIAKKEKYTNDIIKIMTKNLYHTNSDDYSFDLSNYAKSNIGIKFKQLPYTSPLNSIVQNLLNLKIFKNYVYKKETKLSQLFSSIEYSHRYYFDLSESIKVSEDKFPIDILREIDDMSIFQLPKDFPDVQKPIMVLQKVQHKKNLYNIEDNITNNQRQFIFKGLVGHSTISNNCESEKNNNLNYDVNEGINKNSKNEKQNRSFQFYAIIKKHKKYLEIIDNNIREIKAIPDNQTFDLVFYSEKKKVKEIKPKRDFSTESSITNYKKVLSVYSQSFYNFITVLLSFDVALIYYIKFVIRLKDIKEIIKYESNFKKMKLTDDVPDHFKNLMNDIVINFLKISDFSILNHFRDYLVKEIINKLDQEKAISMCDSLFKYTNLLINTDPSRISYLISITREFLKIGGKNLLSIAIKHNFLESFQEILKQCLNENEENIHFYKCLDIHSIFDCLKLFIHEPNIDSVLYIDELLQKIDLIFMNSRNIDSFISLIQGKYGHDHDFMVNFYINIFNKERNSEEFIADVFVHNFLHVQPENSNVLFAYYFEKCHPSDIKILINEINHVSHLNMFKNNFVQMMPSILKYFIDYSSQFSPIISQALNISSPEFLKNLLERVENNIIQNGIENGLSILEFQIYTVLTARFFAPYKLENIIQIMQMKKEDDIYCQFFGDFLMAIPPNNVKPSYLYDIILHEMNDCRVNIVVKFLEHVGGNKKVFLQNPKVRDLANYLMFRGDFYDFIPTINPVIKDFYQVSKFKKESIFEFDKSSSHKRTRNEISIITSNILNTATSNMETYSQKSDFNNIMAVIPTITSLSRFRKIIFTINEPDKLIDFVCNQNICEEFRRSILSLMSFVVIKNKKAFKNIRMNNRIPENSLKNEYFAFFVRKCVMTKDISDIPFICVSNSHILWSIILELLQTQQTKKRASFFVIQIAYQVELKIDDKEIILKVLKEIGSDIMEIFFKDVQSISSIISRGNQINETIKRRLQFIILSQPELKELLLEEIKKEAEPVQRKVEEILNEC